MVRGTEKDQRDTLDKKSFPEPDHGMNSSALCPASTLKDPVNILIVTCVSSIPRFFNELAMAFTDRLTEVEWI